MIGIAEWLGLIGGPLVDALGTVVSVVFWALVIAAVLREAR